MSTSNSKAARPIWQSPILAGVLLVIAAGIIAWNLGLFESSSMTSAPGPGTVVTPEPNVAAPAQAPGPVQTAPGGRSPG